MAVGADTVQLVVCNITHWSSNTESRIVIQTRISSHSCLRLWFSSFFHIIWVRFHGAVVVCPSDGTPYGLERSCVKLVVACRYASGDGCSSEIFWQTYVLFLSGHIIVVQIALAPKKLWVEIVCCASQRRPLLLCRTHNII